MAKSTTPDQVTVSSILDKVGDSLTINICNNGYMIEINGRNGEGDWRTAKLVCRGETELFNLIHEVRAMPKDE